MQEIKADCKSDYQRRHGPIHCMFSLSYASYFCVPRVVLCGMPLWWQKIFVWLIEMLPETPSYVCQRRGEKGRFVYDPFSAYRHGNVEEILKDREANNV